MSTSLKVLVVEHERNADIGLFGERMTAAGVTHDVVGPEIGVPVPASADGYDGVVVLGGTPGPAEDDRAPWLPRVRALIADCLAREVPYLGLCLGGQLLAHVAGGVVDDVRRGPEVGVVPVARTAAAAGDPLFGDVPPSAGAVQWHWLEVVTLPPGSQPLMESALCPNQAFRVGPVAWGTQFHPEALAATVVAWSGGDPSDLAELGLEPQALVDEATGAEPGLRAAWGPLADRFVGVCRGRSRTQSAQQV